MWRAARKIPIALGFIGGEDSYLFSFLEGWTRRVIADGIEAGL